MVDWIIATQLMLMLWELGDITKAINGLATVVRGNSSVRAQPLLSGQGSL